MNLSSFTDAQLVKLIAAASSELASRLSRTAAESVKSDPSRTHALEPGDDDKEFVLRLKSLSAQGKYVTAEERDRIAELAEMGYETWIARQGLPTGRGTGPWRKLGERARVKPAKVR